ncbi:hypothetical protein HDC90_001374 [Pedobacter sp. AK013]|uniref:hypothetical protein n=1 Tax=Pedobacter sp. AK013 TaxID=2723071 RepID=UPI00161FD689|nr:hypothetical protein [Pedobacter sp. AK013]MBB6236759.1 hypothetical protein [Pedobacter sp. AK013]
MKFIISIIIVVGCAFLNSVFGQIQILKLEFEWDGTSIIVGDPKFYFSNEFPGEPDLRKREVLVIMKYEKKYDDLLIAKHHEIDSLSVALARARANNLDTTKLYQDLNLQIAEKHEIEILKPSIIDGIKTEFVRRITLEESTTAVYSEKNYKGNRVILTKDSMDTIVPFYVKSVRVAKGCRVKLYPWKNLRKEPGYDASEVKKNSPNGVDVNIWITSRIGAPTLIGEVTRVHSWRLFCN